VADTTRLPELGPVLLRSASSYEMEPIQWLWKHWLAQKKLHIIAGVPGTAKTTIAMSIAATVSCGGVWPDGSQAPQGDVVIWSGEDSVEDTLKPRLIAAGADLRHIHFVHSTRELAGARPFDPATDMMPLGISITALKSPKLLIIDPVSAAILGDSHKAAEVRAGLQPVVDLAEHLKFAMLGVHHFAKNTSGRNPIDRVIGSVAFSAAPRVVMVVAQPADTSAPFRLTRAKSNVGPSGGGFEYQLLQMLVTEGSLTVATQRVEWGQVLEGSAHEILKVEEPDTVGEALDEAIAFLSSILAGGPMLVTAVKEAATGNGLGWRTVERAKAKLKVKAARDTIPGPWLWSLPAKSAGRAVRED
jgi:hypothetical protein